MEQQLKEQLEEIVSKIKRESRNSSKPIPVMKIKDSSKVYKRNKINIEDYL